MSKSHNKKRNVGIVYGLLLKTAAAGLVEGNVTKQKEAQRIISRFFQKGQELQKEHQLFEALSQNFGFDESLATRVLGEAKLAAKKHNKHRLEREKSKLIKDVNYTFGKGFWKQHLSNYTELATVGQLLETWRDRDNSSLSGSVIYEGKVHQILTKKPVVKSLKEEKTPEVDPLVAKIMVEKFNEKYGKTMTPVQQELIKSYIFVDTEPDRFVKLVESVQKSALNTLQEYKVQCGNDIVLSKIDEVRSQIAEVNVNDISDDNLAKFLKIVDLTEEIRRN